MVSAPSLETLMFNLGLMILALAALTALQHNALSAQTLATLATGLSCVLSAEPCSARPAVEFIRRS
jgi:hypothetical protein